MLTFAPSGWTYEDTFMLYDYETESLWYPVNPEEGMECIGGEYVGKTLDELSGFLLRWGTWKDLHPDTKIMCFGSTCEKERR